MGSEKRFAVLIDADNISAKYVKYIFDEISTEGEITYKRIYGDWTNTANSSWKPVLLDWSITPIQQYSYTTGKNSTDSAMIIDAMDILYSHNVDGFCLASSDSDFTRLAARLRESGMTVIGMGARMTPTAFKSACNKFKYLDLIAQGASLVEAKVEPGGPVAPLAEIGRQIAQIVDDASDDDGWCSLGEIGNILTKRLPDFDVRNYKFARLSNLIRSLGYFDMRSVVGKNFNQVYVRVKDGVLQQDVNEVTGENKPRPRRSASNVKPIVAGTIKVVPAVETVQPLPVEPVLAEPLPVEAVMAEPIQVESNLAEPVSIEPMPVEPVYADTDAETAINDVVFEDVTELKDADAADVITVLQQNIAPSIPSPQPLPIRAEPRAAERLDTAQTAVAEVKPFETTPVIMGAHSISSLRKRADLTNYTPKPVAEPLSVEVTERLYSAVQSPVRAVRFRRFDSDALPIETEETPEIIEAKAQEVQAGDIIKATRDAVDAVAAAVGADPVGEADNGAMQDESKAENDAAVAAETKPEQKKKTSRGRRGKKTAVSDNGEQQKSDSSKTDAAKSEQPKANQPNAKAEQPKAQAEQSKAKQSGAKTEQSKAKQSGAKTEQSKAKQSDAKTEQSKAKQSDAKAEQPKAKQSDAKAEQSKAKQSDAKDEQKQPAAKTEQPKNQQPKNKQQQKSQPAAAKKEQSASDTETSEKKETQQKKAEPKKPQENSNKQKAEKPIEPTQPESTKPQSAASETTVEKTEQKKRSRGRRGGHKKSEQSAITADENKKEPEEK